MKDTSFEAYIADQVMIGRIKKSIKKEERDRVINKACEWLRRNYTNYMVNDLSKYVEDVHSFDIFDDLLVEDFRKAMEE